MKMSKVEKSWVMYDFANSAYATIMVAAIFPVFFTQVCAGAGQAGDYWWGIGTSIATAIVAVMAPIVGTIADFKGYKKKLWAAFLVLGLVFSLMNAIVDNWKLMLVGYVLSHVGFSGANLLNDSFLTDVTTPERMDTISSWAYALGYIGGSTIPFLMSIALVMFGSHIGVDSVMAVKLSLVIMVAWWGIFSIPFLRNVKQVHNIEKPQGNMLKEVFGGVWNTFKSMIAHKGIFVFVLAYFFYIDGVNTVINMSTSYGSALGLDSTGMILALMVTQIVAFPCSILFGRMSRKFGSIKMLLGAISMYLVICITGFVMGFGLEEGFLTMSQATVLFWTLAVMVGSVQGGIQAISRSTFGKLVPPEKSGEYFAFFDIFGKFAAVIGPALYAFTHAVTGRSSFSILSIIMLFLIALLILGCGYKHIKDIE